jgi:hypothetical protein
MTTAPATELRPCPECTAPPRVVRTCTRCGTRTAHEWRDNRDRSVCWACQLTDSAREEREVML